MTFDEIEKRCDKLFDEFQEKELSILNDVLNELIIPFCNNHKLIFGVWNGDWTFLDVDGNRYIKEIVHKGIDIDEILWHRLPTGNLIGSSLSYYDGTK